MNKIEIHYCYPTSEIAESFGKPDEGGFYVTVGGFAHIISNLYRTIDGAEGFCRNKGLTWERHYFRQSERGYFARVK